jgi:PAS domain S-box-containing protein
MKETLKVVNEQFIEFGKMVADRDRELEAISLELALGLSECFEALRGIASGDPEVRIPETSELELLRKLKHMINLTAKNLGEIVKLSHEFAIGLAEHFDILHRVSKGDLSARVSSPSKVELLQSLSSVTNNMIASVSKEIIERERAENAVRQSEEKYRRVTKALTLGLAEVFDALNEISFGNPRVRISEESELDLIADLKSLVNLTAENIGEIVDLSHEFAIGLAEHFDVLHRVSTGDLGARVSGNSSVDLLESLKKVTNEMICSVAQEIRERERAEKALRKSEGELRESEEKYHTLFDYDPNSIFVLDPNSLKILDVNQRCLEVYGYQKKELIGRSFANLGQAPYSDGVLSDIKSTSMKYSVYPKVQHHRKNGHPFYVNVHACKRKRQRKYGIVATTVDITESLNKETQLMQASKMSTLGEMATGVAHELNQPLSAIQIGADFFRNMVKRGEEIPPEDLMLVSEQMAGQVARAVHIINHLRQFGRKAEIQKEKTDINKPLKGVFTLLEQQLTLRGINIVFDITDNLPPVMGESNRLEQVFIDLVVNARDAMEAKKMQMMGKQIDNTLTVRSFREDGRVVVTIADTGIGIEEDIRDKIFEPFFTTKKVGEGTGLGLSISYGIVKDYDGTIDVESEVGKGTLFKISFPACQEENNDR